ncbi:MAG: hypothetical protein L0Z50_27135 [Verrucomicrobiales bacterium]|nr:hypothetical protein [Verrucomicrobiales bacterium]
MNEPHDKIRILLIDDLPEGLWNDLNRKEYPWITDFSREPYRLSEIFELRWIATSGEAREYRDLTRLVAQDQPDQLNWLPEIVVIDYMLLDKHGSAEDRLRAHADKQHLCPIPSLRKLVGPDGLKLQLSQKLEPFAGVKGILEGESDYGCFAGGMILALFADHPSVPVTTTAHDQRTIRQRMTGFFEWLLTEDTGGALHADSQKGMGWFQIAQQAAPRLRARIKDLARIRAISLSLEDLLTLAEGHDLWTLTIESKYGVRRLPIKGLFSDKPVEAMQTEAQQWAGQVIEMLLNRLEAKDHFPDLTGAIKLSNEVWDAYLDENRVRERLELGKLVRELKDEKTRAGVNLDRLKELWKHFSSKPLEPEKLYAPRARQVLDGETIAEIRKEGMSPLSRRWASLMLIVRLLQLRHEAIKMTVHPDMNANIARAIKAELQELDVYLALFPVSHSPIDLVNATSQAWYQLLKRGFDSANETSDDADGVSPLRLVIKDLLEGNGWEENGDASTYGLRPGERELLHWYAISEKPARPKPQGRFMENEWKRDEQARRVLMGGM